MEMQEDYTKTDFISLLDHIDEIPQAQLEEYLVDSENKEVYELYLLAKTKAKRGKVNAPNVDRAWEKFQKNQAEKKKKRRILPMVFSAISGAAAAILIGVVLFIAVQNRAEIPAIVMNYDDSPQVIRIQDGALVETLEETDSISFFVPTQKTDQTLILADNNTEASTKTSEDIKMRTLSTPRGVDFKVTLPDGTEVWLNAESSLQFPSTFSGSTREVILTGEAYFKVSRDEQRPFFVQTDDMTVKVLGTEFDFRNYDTEAASVALVKGSVAIIKEGEEKALLEPGQGAFVTEDNQIKVDNMDIYSRSQWVHGYFYFENQTLVSILTDLSRWYNVGVVFKHSQDMNIKLHFSASRKYSIEEIIDHFNRMDQVSLSLVDNTIVVE